MKGQLVDHLFVGVKRFSMENGAVHDGNSMLENLGRSLHRGVCRHADQCSVYFPHLTHMGQQWNVSKMVGQSFRSTGWPTNERPYREVMAQSNEVRTGLSDPSDSDDCKTQRLRVSE